MMTGSHRLVVGIAVVTAALTFASGVLAAEGGNGWRRGGRPADGPSTETERPATTSGRLLGIVTDPAGAPLEEALISATGPAGAVLALCDSEGRFEFRGLRPGTYLLRPHMTGFTATERYVVEIRSGAATVRAVTLRRAGSGERTTPAFLAAGFGGVSGAFVPGELGSGVDGQPAAGEDGLDGSGVETPRVERNRVAPHDDSERAWWLRRARRSVLKDETGLEMVEGQGLGAPEAARDRFRTWLASDGARLRDATGFPFSGQLHLLTRTTLYSPTELLSTGVLPGQIAYVTLGGAEQQSRWGLQGAVRTGDAGSLVLAGTFATEPSANHTFAVGTSYSRQHLSSSTLALSTPSPPGLGVGRAPHSTSREVGSVSAQGSWAPVSFVDVDYGINVAKYGYLDHGELYSPSAVLTLVPSSRTRIKLAVAQYMLAPGAEEFLPPSRGVWLPPERTFASLAADEPLRAERSRHYELAVERDFGSSSTIGVRRYAQRVDDQMITLFGVRPHFPTGGVANHYYLTRSSGVNLDGWGVMLTQDLAGRVRGAIDYSMTQAEWAPWTARGLSPQTVGVFRAGSERFHDVTTSVETEIPETATRVLLLYRINTAFAIEDAATLRTGVGGRFALRVNQTLPFSPIKGSDWEVLVDVRSLFREPVSGASLYDELLVVSPPKQVVGGLVVHF